MRGTFNGGKAEQKGIEMNGVWQVTPDFNIQASAFFADPEFSEDTIYPDPDEGVAIPAGTTMPVSPEEKYWIALDYTLPNFLDLDGKTWTRFSYSYQGEVWRSTGAILDFVEAETAGGASRRARICCCRRTRRLRCSWGSRPTPAGKRR